MACAKRSRTTAVVQQMSTVRRAGYFEVENPGEDASLWIAKMPSALFLESYLPLFEDLEKDGAKNNRSPCIELELKFPPQYPHSPPFVRVVRPRFQFHTGHVTVGGSICQQDLTSQGWSSTTTVEGLLHSLQQLMIEGKARVDFDHPLPYCFEEAKAAFDRVARDHGWM